MFQRATTLIAVLTVVTGCATAPYYRPIAPLMRDQVVEAGAGAHGEFGRDTMGLGTDAYVEGQLLPPGAVADWGAVQLIARGSATDFFPYAGTGKVFSDVLAEGSAGIRTSYNFSPTLVLGAEALGGYEQRFGSATTNSDQIIYGTVGIPVAEAATPDIWVYTDITLGIAVPLNKNADVPFFGINEIPLGVAWRVTPWLVVVGEGGVSFPVNGGYVGVAAAFRL